MIFAPACLGKTTLDRDTLAADKKACRKFGPCGVGKKALYLNSFFLDRRYYVAFSSVKRVFKRVAMSRGGFTGKGVFGSIPYLVVQYDSGEEKQCNFKHEEDVDAMLAYIGECHPEIPLLSKKGEQRLKEREAREAARYLAELTPQAQSARKTLESAQKVLSDHPIKTSKLASAAKAKRVSETSKPVYRYVALAIVIAGAAALIYGIYTVVTHGNFGVYFALFGFAAIFFFSGANVLPTAKNNKKTIENNWVQAQADMEKALPKNFPIPARYAHPIVITRMIRILREGRAQTVGEAMDVLKADLKALNNTVQVEQEEYDEVVTIKPMFLVSDYK